MMKKLIVILAVIALILVIISVILSYTRARQQRMNLPSQSVPTTTVDLTLPVPDFPIVPLTEEQLITNVGSIVVETVGKFYSQDSEFFNFQLAEPYVSQNLKNNFQLIRQQGRNPHDPEFFQETKVVGSNKIISTDSSAVIDYQADVTRSDTTTITRETYQVRLVKISGRWFVDSTSQLNQ